MSDNRLIQIGRFFDSTQAHIARGILETHDIPCFLFDENHTSTAWHLNIAIGGTRLMVIKEDYDNALEILSDFHTEVKENASQPVPIIRKPYLRTFIGTIIGFFVGAPSIKNKKKRDDNEV